MKPLPILILLLLITLFSCKREKVTEKYKESKVKTSTYSGIKESDTITLVMAITIAEQFLRENGYTKSMANLTVMKYEFMEIDYKIGLLQYRFNNLYPKPHFYVENEEYWEIGFYYSSKFQKKNTINNQSYEKGRAVRINKFNGLTKMVHKTPDFSVWRKI